MTKADNRLTQKFLPLMHCLLFGDTVYSLRTLPTPWGRLYAMGALPTFWEQSLFFRVLPKLWEHYLSFRVTSILWEPFKSWEHCLSIEQLSNLWELCLTQWFSSLAAREPHWGYLQVQFSGIDSVHDTYL